MDLVMVLLFAFLWYCAVLVNRIAVVLERISKATTYIQRKTQLKEEK